MYIEPFWCGVLVTVVVEVAILVIAAVIMNVKGGK